MNTIISTALLALFSTFAAPSSGADAPQDSAHHGKRGHGKLCEKIECTDAQKLEIQAIRAAFKADTADARAAAKALRARYKAAKSVDNPDQQLLAKLRGQMEAMRASMKEAKAETRTAVKAVLTPAQQERLAKLKAEHKANHKGKRDGKADGKRAEHDKRGKGDDVGKRRKHDKQDKAESARKRGDNGEPAFTTKRGKGREMARKGGPTSN